MARNDAFSTIDQSGDPVDLSKSTSVLLTNLIDKNVSVNAGTPVSTSTPIRVPTAPVLGEDANTIFSGSVYFNLDVDCLAAILINGAASIGEFPITAGSVEMDIPKGVAAFGDEISLRITRQAADANATEIYLAVVKAG